MAFRITRTTTVTWSGGEATGSGEIALGSGAFRGPYSLKSRVEDAPATNPEELLGASLGGCYTMSLATVLQEAGHEGVELETVARVTLEQKGDGFFITRITLEVAGRGGSIDEGTFRELAEQAESCPISRALTGTEIVVQARLAASEPA
jgi:osmotically inducible protein OsmC